MTPIVHGFVPCTSNVLCKIFRDHTNVTNMEDAMDRRREENDTGDEGRRLYNKKTSDMISP
jgi:hypothetical protein